MEQHVKFPHMSDRNCHFSYHKCLFSPFPTLFLSAAATGCEHDANELHKLLSKYKTWPSVIPVRELLEVWENVQNIIRVATGPVREYMMSKIVWGDRKEIVFSFTAAWTVDYTRWCFLAVVRHVSMWVVLSLWILKICQMIAETSLSVANRHLMIILTQSWLCKDIWVFIKLNLG